MDRLIVIEEKLTTLLQFVPELEGYKCRLNNLEEENKRLRESLEYVHAENEDMKNKVDTLFQKKKPPASNKNAYVWNMTSFTVDTSSLNLIAEEIILNFSALKRRVMNPE